MPTENHATARERPILFSGPMVRAILEGRKTVTRRAIKHQPDVPVTDAIPRRNYPHGPATVDWYWRPKHGHLNGAPSHGWDFKCPYGEPGDRLWVRETFAHGHQDAGSDCGLLYRATDPGWDDNNSGLRWRPSIHMPRWASRILLEITAVRVERMQDISNEQARAEGYPADREADTGGSGLDAWLWFRSLWESINGAESWAANPWVWVVEFKRVTP